MLTKWKSDWATASSSPQTIIPTSGGDGKWFCTGVTFDAQNERIYLGYQHIYSWDSMNQEHIDIAVLDKNFNIIETQHVTASGYYRPHFLLLDGYLYMAYDKTGGVYIKKYKVLENTSVGISENESQENSIVDVYPNPSHQEVTIKTNSKVTRCELYDQCGSKIKTVSFNNEESISFSLHEIKTGIYFIKIHTLQGKAYHKLIVM